jgi:hypothetical protein
MLLHALARVTLQVTDYVMDSKMDISTKGAIGNLFKLLVLT